MTRNSDLETYVAKMGDIHGAFHHPDPYVFEAISADQSERGVVGDVLEIGSYQGRSAIVLGYLLGKGETLHACDSFRAPNAEDPDFLARTIDWYETYSQTIFEENYLRFHEELPAIYPHTSLELAGKLELKSFRFVHLDGSHAAEALQSDISLVKDILIDDGVIAFAQFRSTHTLEVAAAAWREVASLAVFPICATETYLYASVSRPSPAETARLQTRLRSVPGIYAVPSRFRGIEITLMQPVRSESKTTLRSFVPPVLLPPARKVRSWLAGIRSR